MKHCVIFIPIALKFVPNGPTDDILAFGLDMALVSNRR